MSKDTGLKELPPTAHNVGGETKEVIVKGKELEGDKETKARDSYIEKLNKEQEAKQKKGLTEGDSETAEINKKIEAIDKKNKVEDKSGLGNVNRTNAPLAAGILRHAGNTTGKEDEVVKRESHVKGHENAKDDKDIEQKFKDSRI